MNISERGEISMKASKIMATMLLSALLFTGCGIKDQKQLSKLMTMQSHKVIMTS